MSFKVFHSPQAPISAPIERQDLDVASLLSLSPDPRCALQGPAAPMTGSNMHVNATSTSPEPPSDIQTRVQVRLQKEAQPETALSISIPQSIQDSVNNELNEWGMALSQGQVTPLVKDLVKSLNEAQSVSERANIRREVIYKCLLHRRHNESLNMVLYLVLTRGRSGSEFRNQRDKSDAQDRLVYDEFERIIQDALAAERSETDTKRAQARAVETWGPNFLDFAVRHGWFNPSKNSFWARVRAASNRVPDWETAKSMLLLALFRTRLTRCDWIAANNQGFESMTRGIDLDKIVPSAERLDPDHVTSRWNLAFNKEGDVDCTNWKAIPEVVIKKPSQQAQHAQSHASITSEPMVGTELISGAVLAAAAGVEDEESEREEEEADDEAEAEEEENNEDRNERDPQNPRPKRLPARHSTNPTHVRSSQIISSAHGIKTAPLRSKTGNKTANKIAQRNTIPSSKNIKKHMRSPEKIPVIQSSAKKPCLSQQKHQEIVDHPASKSAHHLTKTSERDQSLEEACRFIMERSKRDDTYDLMSEWVSGHVLRMATESDIRDIDGS